MSGCASGPPVVLPPPTDIGPQPQEKIRVQLNRAIKFGDQELVDLVLECHNVDMENDSTAQRDTPVLED